MSDNMSAALAAVTLIGDPRLAVMVPDNLEEASMVIAAAVWCGVQLAEQLARVLETDRAEVIEALRESMIDAFQADNNERPN